MSFIQNVKIASVPNGTSTPRTIGSKLYTTTAYTMNATSIVMNVQSNANTIRNKNISITFQVKVTAYAATSVTVGAVE